MNWLILSILLSLIKAWWELEERMIQTRCVLHDMEYLKLTNINWYIDIVSFKQANSIDCSLSWITIPSNAKNG